MFFLTQVREARKLSKAQLAIRAGIHPAILGKIESGQIPAFPKYRRLLSEALELPMDILFEKVEASR